MSHLSYNEPTNPNLHHHILSIHNNQVFQYCPLIESFFSKLVSCLKFIWIIFLYISYRSHDSSTPRQTHSSSSIPPPTILLKITNNRAFCYAVFSRLLLFPLSHVCLISSAPCCPNTPIQLFLCHKGGRFTFLKFGVFYGSYLKLYSFGYDET